MAGSKGVTTALVLLFFTLTVNALSSLDSEDAKFWLKHGQDHLAQKLRQKINTGRARNVIVFIGDGMGINTVTAARIYQGQRHNTRGEEYSLSFEKFPFTGLSKTYDVDKQVADSAATAVAIMTGVKVKHHTVGYDVGITKSSCDASRDLPHRVTGMATWAQAAGKSTGFVTTTRVTHATPAAVYAHINDREWECDTKIPSSQRGCVKDIARQLVEDAPGNKLNVILGGGRTPFGVPLSPNEEDDSCQRSDGRNLVEDWLKNRKNAVYVNSSSGLMEADLDNTNHLFGLFSPGHVPYASERSPEHPTLVNMTRQAIRVLNKNKEGFFLMVEAGRIDHAHHGNMAKLAMQEACELDDAVAAAFADTNPDETLIIVTADHSHAFTINGYPNRGNDILGYANLPDETVYETISYANGPGFLTHRLNDSTMNETWKSLSGMERDEAHYRYLSTMYLKEETHGGEDVAVFATGPSAHLLTGVFEQNYIAHVASYAACIGPSKFHCGVNTKRSSAYSSAAPRIQGVSASVIVIAVIMLKHIALLF